MCWMRAHEAALELSNVRTSDGVQFTPSVETWIDVPPCVRSLKESGAGATVMYQIVPSVGAGTPRLSV